MTSQSILNSVKLRPATLDDIESMKAFSYETTLAKYSDIIGREKVEAFIASGAIEQLYRTRVGDSVVAGLGDDLIGVCVTNGANIDQLMVALAHHRSGVGSLLLADAEERLRREHQQLTLDTFRKNHQAVRFYEKHGWTIERHFVDPDHDIPMVRFVK